MSIRTPIVHWLSLRVRAILVFAFFVSTILPPYIPASATDAGETDLPTQQYLFVEEGFLMKTSALGEQGSRLAFSEGLIHQVRDGDSVQKIADRYGISAQTIRWANGMADNTTIKPGEELLILPVNGVLHTVRRGQTLARIAQLYDVPVDDIVRQNRIKGGFIVAGESIIVPGGKPITDSAVAAVNQALQFADAFPSRNIRLPINTPAGAPAPGQGPAAAAALTTTLLQMPCANCFYTQKYRPGHYAVDIQTRGGGPIYAAENGTVIRADLGWNGGFGNVIEVDHGNGLVTLYAHNKTLHVGTGDAVQRGQHIADMGNTGLVHGPTGIHLHFEVRVNGVKRNPDLYLE